MVWNDKNALLCESALLVKGKSFVTLYTDFSFKQLKENGLVKEYISNLAFTEFLGTHIG